MAGILYIVATPIGNLEDITLRGIEVLKSVNLIAAEDTRTSEPLLQKYGIKTPLTSYHKFNEKEKTNSLIEKIKNGESIALVSDAGTPLISDPGNIIVEEAVKNNIKIVPVGGISAVTTFLSSIKREGEDFKFIGFLPKIKSQIETVLKANRENNLVFYESPQRIKETFYIIFNLDKTSVLSIGRELTKKFEEIKTDNIENIISYYEKNTLKGEIVCMLHKKEVTNDEVIKEKTLLLKERGYSLKDTSAILEITDKAQKNKVKKYFLNS